MIAVYIRVSSTSQKTDSQKAEIRQWLKANGFKPSSVQWFEDIETGTTLNREAFQRLQTAIFKGEVKTVVVWKLDRLARKIRDGINTIADWCDKGIRIVSVTQQIDLSGATGHLLASLLFGIAEIELQHSKERQKAGIAVAKKNGVYTGRQSGTTISNPERAQALKAKGNTPLEIAHALNVSKRTVFRYLQNYE
jgi:DNA invertase Pin-like site-specific DNA recombinase